MKHVISVPESADRFDYEAKESDTLWDMVKMLENKFQTTHHFISIYQDRYRTQKLSYGSYHTLLSAFSFRKWYVTMETDHLKLFYKKYMHEDEEKIIYDFSDFEEIVNDTLFKVLYQVSTNPLHKNRNVEIHFSLATNDDSQINDIFHHILPKMVYSYVETDEMGKTHKMRPSYDISKISIDQTGKKLTDHLLNYLQYMIQAYNKKEKEVILSL